MGINKENFSFDLGSITKLTRTVFNAGMTDLEKRKRYLMDLLAAKLKSSKAFIYFLYKLQSYCRFHLHFIAFF